MKTLSKIIRGLSLLTISFGITVACGNNNNSTNSKPTTVASTPLDHPCVNGQTNCYNNFYTSGYQNYGLVPYPVNFYNYGGINGYWNTYGNNGYFCNCPNGYRPVYNNGFGIACMQVNSFQPYYSGAFYWGASAGNNQWVNMQQFSNYADPNSAYQGVYGSCYNQVARTCFIDRGNECGGGSVCQPTSAGSRFGVCVSNGNTQYYGGSGYR